MATFKVGQQVRIANNRGDPIGNTVVGREGVITRSVNWKQGFLWVVKVPGACAPGDPILEPDEWACHPDELAPLTDPGADAFLERMRKLKPYDEPKVEPVRQGAPIWK